MANHDYSKLKKEAVEEYCVVKSNYCLSVPNMMLKLGGANSKYWFIDDPVLAQILFDYGKQDVMSLAYEGNDIYYKDEINDITHESVLTVYNLKANQTSHRRLTTVGVIKIKPFFGSRHPNSHLTVVRYFHLPCK